MNKIAICLTITFCLIVLCESGFRNISPDSEYRPSNLIDDFTVLSKYYSGILGAFVAKYMDVMYLMERLQDILNRLIEYLPIQDAALIWVLMVKYPLITAGEFMISFVSYYRTLSSLTLAMVAMTFAVAATMVLVHRFRKV